MEKRDPGAKAIVFSQFVNMLDVRILETLRFSSD
jgi:hypothetical protein